VYFYQFAGSGAVKCQNRCPAGQGFQCDIAKGFGQTGEQKQVCTGVQGRQLGMAAHAHENGIRALCLKVLAVRTVTRENQFDVSVVVSECMVSVNNQFEVFSAASRPTDSNTMVWSFAPHEERMDGLRCPG